MYNWVYVDYSELEGDVYFETPKVYGSKKAAMEAFNARVKKVMEEEINEWDDIINKIESPGYLHLCVNYNNYYTIYVKRVKVRE